MKRHLFTATATLIANTLLGAGPAAPAPENLLFNGDFSQVLSGWSRAATVSWTPFGSSNEGSAMIRQHDDARGADVLIQCLAVEGGRLYDFSASAYLPYDPTGTGGVTLHVRWHAEADCRGPALGGTAALDFSRVAPVAWQRKEIRLSPAPVGTMSALVDTVARADARETYTFFVDDISLTRSVESETLTLRTAATVTGALGQRFQTDLFIHNPAPAERLFVLKFYPAGFEGGFVTPVVLHVGPRETRRLFDVLGDFFGARDRAGALEIDYDPRGGPMQAFARAVTIHPENPGNGMSIPLVTRDAARATAEFLGLTGDGQRVNAGAFNPTGAPVELTFTVRDTAGRDAGSVTRTWKPYEWFQINDVAGQAGVAAPGSIVVTSPRPVFPFVIAIDNRSGDPTFLEAQDLIAIP